MRTNYFLISLLLFLTACGFHLRGSQEALSLNISNVYIQAVNAARLAAQVRSDLSASDVTFSTTPTSADYVIRLANESLHKSILSVSPVTGKVEEYQLEFSAFLSISKGEESLLSNKEIRMVRDYTFDEDAVLGKASEEEVLNQELIGQAASQIIRQIQIVVNK